MPSHDPSTPSGDTEPPAAIRGDVLEKAVPEKDELPPPRRRQQALLLLLGAVLLLGVAAAAAYRPVVRYLVVREARKNGIALGLGEVSLGWSRVTLTTCDFAPVGFEGVRGRVDRLDIALAGWLPRQVEARGVELEVVGSAATLAMGLGDWAKSYPLLLRIPSKADAVSLAWRADVGGSPWLAISGATIEPAPTGGRFTASRAKVLDVAVGRVGASWSGSASSIALGFGEPELEAAPVLIDVRYADADPEADITLRPTPLEKLAGPLGMVLPLKGVSASAFAQLRFKGDVGTGAVLGSLKADLTGYSPPLPAEMRAFVSGKDTHFESEFAVSTDRRRVELTRAEVTHGGFRLEGRGSVDRQPDHARVVLELSGHLRCADVAKAVARARLGSDWGGLLGPAVDLSVQGSITVGVRLEVDTRNLAGAKLSPKVSLGCGLRSLDRIFSLPALPSFKLPTGR
jgi:hypothetical protein